MNRELAVTVAFILLIPQVAVCQQKTSGSWIADQGDGTYINPILHADYSDPDVVCVGDDYYMTASSFNCVPGLPVLHSKDLINWELIGYALDELIPADVYNKPQHGNGVWAPCIRYHDQEFYIYFPDPDHGIYLTKATNPEGPWSEPVLVKGGKGLIDPSPLWDDDGKVYLAFAFAGSRASLKSVLIVAEMNREGTRVTGRETMVFDGHESHPTVEGPKFYKRNGYYYIFAPAGGVTHGWQLVLRAQNIYGPYEEKVVLAQGESEINGPHQGAWIQADNKDWFIHFQDKEAYGRIVHLQPMTWKNDWPVIGKDTDGDGTGEPVLAWTKPKTVNTWPVVTPPEDDEFNGNTLGIQWQWHANPSFKWGFPSGNMGFYRLNCMPRPEGSSNLWTVPNLLLQKFPAEEFTTTAKVHFDGRTPNEQTGFVVMGEEYQYISLRYTGNKYWVNVQVCEDAPGNEKEKELFSEEFTGKDIFFRVEVLKGALCRFSYSSDGVDFKQAGTLFRAQPGKWIGAKIGFFALREEKTNDAGTVDIDWFRITK